MNQLKVKYNIIMNNKLLLNNYAKKDFILIPFKY